MDDEAGVIKSTIKLVLLVTLTGWVFNPNGSLPRGSALGAQPQPPEQAVVRVGALEPRKPPATGFLISPDGYILTAAHVVCGSTKFRVRLEGDASPRDDPQQWREARLVPIKDMPNPLISRDLALLKIEGQQLPFLRLGDSDQVRRGDAIKAIGYPSALGGIQATTQGTVTNTGASRNLPICGGNPELKNLIVTDVSITQGNSGGPLLRRNERTGEEEVIGIVNGIAALALATPINAALEDFLPRQALPAYQPQITTLEFPKEFFQGQKVEGQVGFWDANKDVAFAFVEVVELGGRTPVSVQQCCPQVFGKLSGEIRFTIEIPVTPSAPEQLTLRVTLLDLAGNQSKPEEQRFRARLPKPEIIDIDFPSEIRADRQPNLGTVRFKDPNADVELARFDRVEGPFEPFVINLRERGLFGKPEGIIDFTIRAQEAGRVTVRVTLIDAKGLRSEPKEFSFTAQPVGPPPQPPVLRVEPDRLDFSATVGGPNPSPKNLTITNAGSGTLNWAARIVNAPWLALSAARGTAPSTITASVNIAGLAAGSFSGLIVIEAAGAQNSPVTVPVTLELQRPADRTPPRTQASLSPQPNANGWHNSDVTVTLRATDESEGSGVKEICWQLSGATQRAFSCQGGSTATFTLSAEGTTTVEYQARDNAGNEEPKQRMEVRLDKSPPSGSLTINDGAASTTSTSVTLRISASDAHSGVWEMRFSNDGRTWSDWEGFSSTRSWDLTRFGGSVAPGPKTVYAQLRDRAGNASQAFSASITLIPPSPGMVLIPAGSFQMGDNFGEGDPDERLVHTVFVSAFYMDKYEVTKALWDEVAHWAKANGYDIKPEGGSGKGTNHPVYYVTWYEAVKWANARSEREGLTPCYYTDSTQATVYRTGSVNVPIEGVKWSGCGYRLPTEAEWEYAARGRCEGHRFPWCDTDEIQHSRANYYSSSDYSYDTSPTRGYHPTYATGGESYTSPVGSFAANGYGLYDMAGNVWEWVWDWYDSNYYSRSPGSDPHGPASGSYRVRRGGSWSSFASNCRVAGRTYYSPGSSYYALGFRLVRTAP